MRSFIIVLLVIFSFSGCNTSTSEKREEVSPRVYKSPYFQITKPRLTCTGTHCL